MGSNSMCHSQTHIKASKEKAYIFLVVSVLGEVHALVYVAVAPVWVVRGERAVVVLVVVVEFIISIDGVVFAGL